MADKLASFALQYGVYGLEVGLLMYLLFRGHSKRLVGLTSYVSLLLVIDVIGRPYVLYAFGLASREYANFFWLTDVLLALGAFLLVCSFFRRACAKEEKLRRFVRLLLFFVFILVLGISSISLSRNYKQLFTFFIVEFEQNLYFTCLVLTTMLYVLMQQLENEDDELGLLVCGMGMQFAGPAASLALVHLASAQQYAQTVNKHISPLCTLGMLLTWLYAVARMPKPAPVPATPRRAPEGREVAVTEA